MRRLPLLPSASKLGLARECLYPWTSGIRWPGDFDSRAAAFGKAVHKVAEVCIESAPWCTWDEAIEWCLWGYDIEPAQHRRFRACAERVREEIDELEHVAVDMDERFRMCIEAEVAFLYDVPKCTARRVTMEHARDRDLRGPTEIAAIVDVVYWRDGVPRVRNWKTGRTARETAARDSLQLRLEALAAARALGWSRVVAELAHVDEDGVEVDAVDLDAFALDGAAGELLELGDEMQVEQAPRPGPWCAGLFCPIREKCPAIRGALRQVDPAPLGLPFSVEITSAEHCASVRNRRKAVEAACEQIKKAEHDWIAKHGAIEVAPGVMCGLKEHRGRETIDVEKPGAMAAIREVLGSDEAADVAVEVSASKASIARGVAKAAAAKGVPKATLEREVFARLREVGAISEGKPYTKVEEWKVEES